MELPRFVVLDDERLHANLCDAVETALAGEDTQAHMLPTRTRYVEGSAQHWPDSNRVIVRLNLCDLDHLVIRSWRRVFCTSMSHAGIANTVADAVIADLQPVGRGSAP
jgi:hypothetical protein